MRRFREDTDVRVSPSTGLKMYKVCTTSTSPFNLTSTRALHSFIPRVKFAVQTLSVSVFIWPRLASAVFEKMLDNLPKKGQPLNVHND